MTPKKKKNEGAENKVFFIYWRKENSTGESMMTSMKGVKTKRLQHPFQVFQARTIIFQKGSYLP